MDLEYKIFSWETIPNLSQFLEPKEKSKSKDLQGQLETS